MKGIEGKGRDIDGQRYDQDGEIIMKGEQIKNRIHSYLWDDN